MEAGSLYSQSAWPQNRAELAGARRCGDRVAELMSLIVHISTRGSETVVGRFRGKADFRQASALANS
jgi:hypothetical protein